MAITSTPLTLEEFLRLPEEKPALEFFERVVTQKVSPKLRHGILQFELTRQLNRFGLPNKAARAVPELRATFGGASVVPDIAVYLWDRIPVDAEGEAVDDLFTPPDIAVEIVSPEQGVNAVIRRCLWYVANGVQVALLVDPADKSILVFRPGQQTSALHGADRIDLPEVLPDFELTVDELFAALHHA